MAKRYALFVTDVVTGERKRIAMSTSKRELEAKASVLRAVDPFTVVEVVSWPELVEDVK